MANAADATVEWQALNIKRILGRGQAGTTWWQEQISNHLPETRRLIKQWRFVLSELLTALLATGLDSPPGNGWTRDCGTLPSSSAPVANASKSTV
jgi:hypothetical protein